MRFDKPALQHSSPRCLIVLVLLFGLLGTAVPMYAQDKAVATVNGQAINQSDFYTRLEHLHGRSFIVNNPPNPPSLIAESAGYLVMNLLINQQLVIQLAAKNDVAPTDAEVATELQTTLKQDNVKKAVADKQVTEQELKADIRATKAQLKLATKGIAVTDKEVEDWYTKHKANYTLPERWGLSVIRTSKPEDIPKIQGSIKTLSFATAAREYSEDMRTRSQGGNMGIVFATDPGLPDSIRAAVRKLKVGEVSPPVEIEFDDGGKKMKVWWLLKLDQLDAEVIKPLADVKQEVQQLAMLEKAGGFKATDDKVSAFRKQSDIKINLPGYDALANTPKP